MIVAKIKNIHDAKWVIMLIVQFLKSMRVHGFVESWEVVEDEA